MKFKAVQNVRHTRGITRQIGFPSRGEIGKLKSRKWVENALKSYIIDFLLRKVNGHNTIYPDHEKNSLVERMFLDTIVIILNPLNLTIIGALGLNKSNPNKPKVDQIWLFLHKALVFFKF